jgi:DNA-binding CsgD family transcriptional regulator
LEPQGNPTNVLRQKILAVRVYYSALFNKYNNVLFAVLARSLLCSLWEGTNLPRKSPYKIILTKQEREELERRANKYTLSYFIVTRAKMILLAAQGLSNDEIANSLSTRREIVSRWRKRFFEKRLGGLEDFPRPGRPRVFPPRAGRAR